MLSSALRVRHCRTATSAIAISSGNGPAACSRAEPAAEAPAEPVAEVPVLATEPRCAQVCSAAELEIARLLDSLGLDYAYRVAPAGASAPDGREPSFTIRDQRQGVLLWDHLGALDSEGE